MTKSSLRGALDAAEAGIIIPILVGPAKKINAVAREHGFDISRLEIVDAGHSDAAAAKAVQLIHEAKGELLMKGSLHTDELMRAVTASATGLRTARRISHVFIVDVPSHSETLFITDAAINIFPDLDVKRDIVQNAIDLFTQVGLGTPRVAILSAVETVTSKIPSTIEAAALCKMADRGQITGGVLDGPLAFDNAVDPEAARIKGIKSPVAGRAQILVVPDLEAGNMLAKNSHFPVESELSRHCAWCARSDHPDVAGRHRTQPPGVVRGCGTLCRCTSSCCRSSCSVTRAMDTILVVNAGSSSVKFQVFAIGERDNLTRLIKGQMDGIGSRPRLRAETNDRTSLVDCEFPPDKVSTVPEAIQETAKWLREHHSFNLFAVGHRVVHGGPDYNQPILVDERVLAHLERYISLAPLHQPNNLAPIRTLLKNRPELPQVACFDTAFHRSHNALADHYAIPGNYTMKASVATGFMASRMNTLPIICGRLLPMWRISA